MVLEKLKARKRIDDWLASARVIVGEDVWETWIGTDGDRLAVSLPTSAPRKEERPEITNTPKQARPAEATAPKISKLNWLLTTLSGMNKGLTAEEIADLARENVKESGFLGDHADYAYWVTQTANRGKLKRRGGLFFTRELWDRLAEEGAVSASHGADLRGAILEAVKELGPGCRAVDIIKHTRKDPEIVRTISPTSQYPYVLLGRMATEGALLRSGRDYFLPGTSLPSNDDATAELPHLKLVGEARPRTA